MAAAPGAPGPSAARGARRGAPVAGGLARPSCGAGAGAAADPCAETGRAGLPGETWLVMGQKPGINGDTMVI